MDIYDTDADTDNWSVGKLSQARYGLAGTVLDDVAFFAGGHIGGYTATGCFSDVVDIYDDETGWGTTYPLSQPRVYLSATTVGDMAIFAGGQITGGYSDVVDIYIVPEPATLLLFGLGGLALRLRSGQALRRKCRAK